jgi:hypothetical protein
MRSATASLAFTALMFATLSVAHAQIEWIGGTSNDVLDGTNWDGGLFPGVSDNVVFRNGGASNPIADIGASNVEWAHMLMNHADVGTTINGTGTITLNTPGAGFDISTKSFETQGGDRLSTIHPNIIANGVMEARNGHNVVFEGDVTSYTLHSYNNSVFTFNGTYTQTAYEGSEFFTGNHEGSSIVFNGGLNLDRPAFYGDLGIRNGLTVAFGPDVVLTKTGPFETTPGLGTVNLYNQSTIRLDGDNALDANTDLFSRDGGGIGENTLDLNGFSTTLEFIATVPDAGPTSFVVDYGQQSGPNTFRWLASHWMPGDYKITNFEVGVDTLELGEIGSFFWTAEDTTNSGGGSPDIEVKKSQITINGIPYAPYDPLKTDAYWTLVDPTVSRAIEVFNAPLFGDYNDDGEVNAADYTVYRDNLNGSSSALNGNGSGGATVGPADYQLWAQNYGRSNGGSVAIPEPASLLLALTGVALCGRSRRRACV